MTASEFARRTRVRRELRRRAARAAGSPTQRKRLLARAYAALDPLRDTTSDELLIAKGIAGMGLEVEETYDRLAT